MQALQEKSMFLPESGNPQLLHKGFTTTSETHQTMGYDRLIQDNLPHAINFRALCGANLVTITSKMLDGETLELHGVGGVVIFGSFVY